MGTLLLILLVGVLTVSCSTGLANAQLDRLFNGGSGTNFESGKLQIWSGSAPAVNAAPTGTKVWEFALDGSDAVAAASGKAASINGTVQANALASVDMTSSGGYWRLVKSGDAGTNNTTDERLQGSVTATGGGGDMTLQNMNVASGQNIALSTKTITHP